MTPSPSQEPSHHDDEEDAINIAALSELCGIQREEILEFHRLHLVSLHHSGGTYHAGVHTLHRLRHISILREEHDMKPTSIGFVLDLMDRLDAAERELRSLRERL